MIRFKKQTYKLFLGILLVPFVLSVFSLTSVGTHMNGNTSIVLAKGKAKDKTSNKDNNKSDNDNNSSTSDSGAASGSSSNGDQSAWNSAVSTLSQGAVGSGKSSSGDNKPSGDIGDQQANVKTVTSDGAYLNAWGFMGDKNTDVWEKNNNSSSTVSYSSLVQGGTGSDNLDNAYKQAGRFAYGMQATGVDKPVKAGFTSKPGVIQQLSGWVMQLSYFVLNFAQRLFNVALDFLDMLNPLSWAVQGVQNISPNSPIYPVASFISRLYDSLFSIGTLLMLLCLTVAISFIPLGITIGGSSISRKNAALNTIFSYFKRGFVAIVLPVFALAFFSATINMAKTAFTTNSNSVPNYAVYGSLVDYNDWAMNSRLGLPSDVSLPSSFSPGRVPSLSHDQILAINYKGAGISALGGLYQQAKDDPTSSETALNPTNSNSKTNTDLDDTGKSLLGSWMSGNSITAADYASSQDAGIRQAALDKSKDKNATPDLKGELVKAKYNGYDGNATNYLTGYTNKSLIRGNTDDSHSVAGFAGDSANGAKPGGLSTLGMYTYMLTTASSNNMTIGDTDQLQNDVAQPSHSSVVMVGNGITSTGNLIWALGMMVGLAMLIVGYLLEAFKTIWFGLAGLSIGTFGSALHSIRGGVQLASVVVGMYIGIFGTAIMYQLSQMSFIAIAEMLDNIIVKNLGSIFSGSSVNVSNAAALSSTASQATVEAAVNMLYGIALLALAILFLRFRAIVVASLSSLVEEVSNRFMSTLASATGSSSAGTRQIISRSANSSNSSEKLMTGVAKTGATGLLLAGGTSAAGHGLKSLLSGGLGKKPTGDKASQTSSTATNNNGKSFIKSSSDQQGNAAQNSAVRDRQNSDKTRDAINSSNNSDHTNDSRDHRSMQNNNSNNDQLHNQDGQNTNQNSPLSSSEQNMSDLSLQNPNNANALNSQSSNDMQQSDSNQIGNAKDRDGLSQSAQSSQMNSHDNLNNSNGLQSEKLSNAAQANPQNDNNNISQNGVNGNNANGDLSNMDSPLQDDNSNDNSDWFNPALQPNRNGIGAEQLQANNNSSSDSQKIGQNKDGHQNVNNSKNAGLNHQTDQPTDQSQSISASDTNAAQQALRNGDNSNSNLLDNDGSQKNMHNVSGQNDMSALKPGQDQVMNGNTTNNSPLNHDQSNFNSNDLSSSQGSLGDVNTLNDGNSSKMPGNESALHNGQSVSNTNHATLGDASDVTGQDANGQMLGANGGTSSSGVTSQPNNNSLMHVQSQMNGIQSASDKAHSAATLASQNPGNQTLQKQANVSQQALSGLQNNAISSYNQQPISSLGKNAPSWLNQGANTSNLSIGSANNAMNSIYQAQQSVDQAKQQFGANSPQVSQAQTSLSNAQQAGQQLGISPEIASDPQQVTSAHNQITQTMDSLKSGKFKAPDSVAHMSGGNNRTIGI